MSASDDDKAKTGEQEVVLIVGGGFGGLGAAEGLVSSHVAAQHKVIVVSLSTTLTIGACQPFVWSGRADEKDATWNLTDAQGQFPGVTFRLGTSVKSLDIPQKQAVLSDGTVIAWNHLVLGTGLVSDPQSISGLDSILNICNPQHMNALKSSLQDFTRACQDHKTEDKLTFLLSIGNTPYKCPPAPFETIFLVEHHLREQKVRDKARLVISCPVPWPFGGPVAKKAFSAELKSRGIEYLPQHTPTRVDVGSSTVHYANDASVSYQTLWSVYPQHAPQLLIDAGLTNKRGFVPVDFRNQRVLAHQNDNVYAVGDCCWAMLPSVGKPHPKAGEFAYQMGQVASACISASVSNKPQPMAITREGVCAAELGGQRALRVNPSFTECLRDPPNGKPGMLVTPVPAPNGHDEKIAWINGFVTRFFGEQGRAFAPSRG